MTNLLQDLRFALRTLRKGPGFTFAALGTLALGIGATSAMFALVYGLLLRPLALPEPERLVSVWTTRPASGFFHASVSYVDSADWRQQARSFERIATMREQPFTLTGEGEAVVLSGARVTHDFFDMLGVRPAIGRGFEADDARPGAPLVAVLSHGCWQRRFGGDPRSIGRRVVLGGEAATLVGVLPAGVALPGFEYQEIWAPLEPAVSGIERGERGFGVIGRLARGVSREQAQAELSGIAERAERAYPATNQGIGVNVLGFADDLYGDRVRIGAYTMLGAVALVLLVGCTNLASLMLARGIAREQELAVRVALGASRARLVRQLLTESLLLALGGAALGLLVAVFGLRLLVALLPSGIPRLAELALDSHTLVFALAVGLLSAAVFGLVPALRAAGNDVGERLKSASPRAGLGGRRLRLQRGLVVAEITLAFVLLFGAGLLGRSLRQLSHVDPGFRPAGVLTLELGLPATVTDAASLQFWQQSLERIAARPDVEHASVVSTLPMGGSNSWVGVAVESTRAGQEPRVGELVVAPDYFASLGIQLLAGRDFARTDAAAAPATAIVNQAMARLLWPGRSALGQTFVIGRADGHQPPVQVIGVAGDVRHRGRAWEVRPEMFLPLAQHPTREMVMVLRTRGEPIRTAPAAAVAIHSIDPNQAVTNVRPLEAVLEVDLAGARLLAGLTAAFAATALALAALGVHGVVSFTVAQATREIGIRIALGAGAGNVLRLVLARFLGLACLGLGLGVLGALLLGRLTSSLLFGVPPQDPMTALAVATILLGVVCAATLAPAWRAARLEPTVALRCE